MKCGAPQGPGRGGASTLATAWGPGGRGRALTTTEEARQPTLTCTPLCV